MRRFIDLHTHSKFSDGSLTPAELVRQADVERLAAVALTDHDTIDGLVEARAAAAGFGELAFVGGIEVSAMYSPGTMHILALGIHERERPVRELGDRLRAARDERNPKIVARLQEMGVDVTMADVLAVAGVGEGERGRVISRVHIAEAIRRKGHVATVAEAFDRYIGNDRPAYVDKERLDAADVIKRIRRTGALAVLAHPAQLRCRDADELERVVQGLVDAGLEGLEVYHTDHSDLQTRQYLDLARRHGLAVTGGSDFHGPAKPGAALGRPRVPLSALGEELLARLAGRP